MCLRVLAAKIQCTSHIIAIVVKHELLFLLQNIREKFKIIKLTISIPRPESSSVQTGVLCLYDEIGAVLSTVK